MYPSLSIILPTFRESDNLRKLIPNIVSILGDQTTRKKYEIIVVDDDSQDGTEPLVRDLQDKGFPVSISVRKNERGLSSAVLHGFCKSDMEVCLVMDADFQHPPEVIPMFWKKFKNKNIRFVTGSREKNNAWPLHRQVISLIASSLALPLTRCSDPMTGIFAASRASVMQHMGEINPMGYKIALELIVKCKFPTGSVEEVPYQFGIRHIGESKLTGKVVVQYLFHLFHLYWHSYKNLVCVALVLIFTVMCITIPTW